jgi:hypothetical protein
MDKEKIEGLLREGRGYEEIGRVLGIPAHVVRTVAREYGGGTARFVVPRSPWRQEEDDLARMLVGEGKGAEEIAAVLPGRSVEAVRWRCSTYWKKGIEIVRGRKVEGGWTPEEDNRGMRLLEETLLPGKVAEVLGRTIASVHKRNQTRWRIKVPSGPRKHVWTDDGFFNTWSRNMAYVLGFVVSDGNVSKDLRCLTITQSHACGREILDRLKGILGGNITGPDEDDSNRLLVHSRPICDRLVKMGVPPAKSLIVEMPGVPDEFLADFVRGLLDGDGSVTRAKTRYGRCGIRVEISSGSQKFREQIRDRIGSHTGLIGGFDGISVRWTWNAALALLGWLYEGKEGSIWLPRKFEKYQELLAERTMWVDKRFGSRELARR